jgi:hypothetical protein
VQTQLSNFSVELEYSDTKVFLSLVIHGTLSHEDYMEMTPMLESVFDEIDHPTINALIDITDLEGWTLHAAWDDLQLGLNHGRQFKKIAIIGNQHWQQMLSKVGDWFVAGDVHYFENKDPAIGWLNECA